MNYDKLVKEAIDAIKLSRVHFEGTYGVGAAVLTKKGNIYQGAYIAADVGYLCRHAEDTAITHAILHKDYEIVAIAVVSEVDKGTDNFCSPCGICKELIYEISLRNKKDVDVVMANPNGKYKVKKISELTPDPWIK